MDTQKKEFILMMADNVMILGQQLGSWCGHGPILEQDIAMTNIALDLIGEARNYYQYLAEQEGLHEDDYPMKRDVREFRNVLLVEQPNGHWGDTLMRQCLFDCYHYYLLEAMVESRDERLAAIAKKSIKEAAYHLSFSGEWVIRLGDGTEESHQRMQASLERLYPFFEECFVPASFESACLSQHVSPDLQQVSSAAKLRFRNIIEEATLKLPEKAHAQKGGKSGLHSEHLGFILSDMQFMQRAYPGLEW
jgi:ring-1,2-phenylacetyl-CoA epoxidase subunit PaaC